MKERRLKVEQLERRLLLASDFGDAPAPYDTLLADDGAEHQAVGPTLGAIRDTELNGVPSTLADGDGADEDGVTFGAIQVGALDATVTVNVQGAPGKLDAWIDFNSDGSWGGPGERIFASRDVVVGDNLLTFDVPSYAIAGTTYARFRLSTSGGLGVGGYAVDGEVEDYAVTTANPSLSGAVFEDQSIVTTAAVGAESVYAADVDGDGDLDVISASSTDGKVAWHENDGSLGFTEHAISATNISAQEVFAADVDGDGDLDVLSASRSGAKLAWYENDGSQNFTEHAITTIFTWASDVFAADMDGDGDMDLVSATDFGGAIAWYENDGSQNFAEHIISTSPRDAVSVFASDLDGDGDLDVLSASDFDNTIAWYENDGNQVFTEHTISTTANGANDVFAADVDDDGDLDVLSASSTADTIAWYENNGSQIFTEHTISTDAEWAYAVFAADMDGDGDLDVIAASRFYPVTWYENDGSQNFVEHQTSDSIDGARSVFPADVDGDGDLDILSVSEQEGTIAWHLNTNHSYDFAAPTFIAAEEDTTNTSSVILLERSGPADVATHVDVVLTGGSATAGSDFTTEQVTVNFAVGEMVQPVPIEILGDTSAEGNETILLSLTNFSGESKQGTTQPTAVYYIQSDDPADLGDAPTPYPTTHSEFGAQHAATGLTLGASRDVELDGTHSAAADGDGTDEDGVTFGAIQVGQLDATVTVNVQGAAGKLDAWIDFNGDGSWGGPGEQVFASRDVVVGNNTLTFDVPGYAIAGTTYARFRLSTSGGLGVGSFAADGEVEDYAVTVVSPTAASGPFDASRTISTSANGAYDVFAADVDGDGDLDVLSASSVDDTIAWYENDGSQNFTEHTISTTVNDAQSVFAADLDGDGDLDVLSASSGIGGEITWYENDGNQNFFAHTIDNEVLGVQSVYAADVDGDGDLDVLIASTYRNNLIWYENDGSENFTLRSISTTFVGAFDVHTADVDGDGDLDVLSASIDLDTVSWFENDGNENFTEREISTTTVSPRSVFTADLDDDGDLDVISASFFDDKIAWHENDGSENFTEHIISTTADGAYDVFAADVDGDGDLDVLGASFFGDTIAWYENDGSGDFTKHEINTSADGAHSVFASDVDGNGYLDVLSASYWDHTIEWYYRITHTYDFAAETFSVAEGDITNTTNVVQITRSGDTQRAANVDVVLTNGTATAGSDFVSGPITVEFAAGETTKAVPIEILGDILGEDVESINLSLTNFPTDAVIGTTQPTAILYVENDDPADYGDAPTPYPTTDAVDGARHADTGPTLGATRDVEPAGTHSTAADADGADEDGVTFGAIQVGALDATVTVNVQGAPGKLDAWIDFNGDGSWGSPGEQVFDSRDLAIGDNLLTFDVPSYAIAGTTYARFRLSTAGGLGLTGLAADGEVEDYQITVVSSAAPSGAFEGGHAISTTADGATDVFAADVDGDGDMDVLSASEIADTIAWYENDGNENFTERTISTTANGANSVFAADVDGDGDLDVLSASEFDDTIAWYENNGNGNFTERIISTTANGANSVFAADVDGDGDLDVLSASEFDDTIAWYENDGSQNFTERIISMTANGANSVFAADVDGDGDMDVLSASELDDTIAWYENDGSQNFTEHTISTFADGAYDVHAADVDGDGDLDVLGALSRDHSIVWYENDGDQGFTEHFITTTAVGARSVSVGDVDGNGYLDVLSASYNVDTIEWFYQVTHTYDFTAPTFIAAEGDETNATSVVQVMRSGATDVATSIDVIVSGGTATDGSDFTEETITVNFAVDESIKSVPIEILGDTVPEYHETINLSLSNPSHKTGIGTAQPSAILQINNDDPADFGDAPSPYPTIFSELGALHIASGPTLGFTRDSEVDGVHSANADADGADEDGVTFGAIRVGALDATVTVNVQGAPAKLDAWIDFNGDGSWGGPDERVFANYPVTPGDNELTFDVPSWAISGNTYARFRLSTEGGLGVVGPALDGEVEDYEILIDSPSPAGSFGDALLVSSEANGATDVFAADLDNDGDVDVVSTSRYDNKISWHENVGGQSFVEHVVSTAFIDPSKVIVADINGDGDLDLLAVSDLQDKIAWLENDGDQNFSLHLIAESAPYVFDVTTADVDEDGDLDVVSKHSSGTALTAWYENDGDENFTYQGDASPELFVDLLSVDLDGDGDLDQLTFSGSQDTIEWLENDGAGNFTAQVISVNIDSPTGVFATDIDADGDLDVLATSFSNDSVYWFENSFEASVITTGGTTEEVLEENLQFEFQINLPRSENTSLTFLASGLATVGVDYSINGHASLDGDVGTVVIPLGQTSVMVTATPVDDSLEELDETFELRLVEGLGYFVDDSGNATWTIVSDEFGGDFGDAPAPYPSLFADNGAAHSQGVPGSPQLGVASDIESDGQPSELADGDGADDDGVVFGEIRVGQADASFTVTVENAPQGARLDAWFDFNGDGNWFGAGEQIARSAIVNEGENTLYFSVPTDVAPGSTYARFRLSTAGGLAPTGIAADGEVEDYLVEILPPRAALGVDTTGNEIVSTEGEVRSLFAIDLDQDQDQDIVAAAGNAVVWYENDGAGNFTEHVVIDTASYASAVKAADVDDDGDLDLLSASRGDDTIAWYENDGALNFTEHIVTTSADGAKDVEVADLDGDGDLDLLSASENDNVIAWYENNGAESFTKIVLIAGSFNTDSPDMVHVLDMDNDGDLDLVVGADGFFAEALWFENNGQQQFSRRRINSGVRDIVSMYPVDLDLDRDSDLLVWNSGFGNSGSVYWLEHVGPIGFTNPVIEFGNTEPIGQFSHPKSLVPADIDGDGDWDLLLTSVYGETLSVLVNDGRQNFESKALYTAPDSTDQYSFNTSIAADLDGDGDLDIVAAPQFEDKIYWYESYPDGTKTEATEPTIVEDSGGSSTIIFTRRTGISEQRTLAFQVLGSATFDVDYTVAGATSYSVSDGSVTFLAGEDTASLTLTSVPDADFEDDETIRLQLFDSTGIQAFSDGINPFEVVITILRDEASDYGDAPDTFRTTYAVDGAVHGDQGPTLGALRDADSDGQPSGGADGDGTDEDGVTFSTMYVGQQDAMVTVNLQNAPSGARLDAWFDFNGDGNWLAADEQVVHNLQVVEGDNFIAIDIPPHAISGEVHTRFRISSAGSLSHYGFAVDGEVEDYLVTIEPPAASAATFSLRPAIGALEDSTAYLDTGDIDGDGDIDIVGAGGDDSALRWYENQASGTTFVEHEIYGELLDYLVVELVDFDHDGDLDVLGTSRDGQLIWHDNNGDLSFSQHQIVDLTTQPDDLEIVDADGDGDLDILLTTQWPYELLLIENLGNDSYTTHRIAELSSEGFGGFPTQLEVGDIDHDGDLDIVAGLIAKLGSYFQFDLAWYENQGNKTYVEHPIGTTVYYDLVALELVDLNRDGNLDVLYEDFFAGVRWLMGDGSGTFVSSSLGNAYSIGTTFQFVDLDGDGDIDPLVYQRSPDRYVVYENNGGYVPSFKEHLASGFIDIPRSTQVADIDGDGDLDLISFSSVDDSVVWFENIARRDAGDFDGDGMVTGGDFLAAQRSYGSTSATREQGDADGDGDVDSKDIKDWEATYGYTVPPDPLPGDFDEDGVVTGRDFLAWQRDVGRIYDQSDLVEWEEQYLANSTLEEEHSNGDLDQNGIVDGRDFLEWQRGVGNRYDSSDLQAWEAAYAGELLPESTSEAAAYSHVAPAFAVSNQDTTPEADEILELGTAPPTRRDVAFAAMAFDRFHLEKSRESQTAEGPLPIAVESVDNHSSTEQYQWVSQGFSAEHTRGLVAESSSESELQSESDWLNTAMLENIFGDEFLDE